MASNPYVFLVQPPFFQWFLWKMKGFTAMAHGFSGFKWVFKPSLKHSIESWLVKNGIPRSWNIILPNISKPICYWDILGYMKGSIIPELIINRQGYRSQPLRKMWFSPFLLPSPGCRLLGFSSFSVCRCSRQKLQSWMHLAEMWTATEKIGSSWDFNGILMGF